MFEIAAAGRGAPVDVGFVIAGAGWWADMVTTVNFITPSLHSFQQLTTLLQLHPQLHTRIPSHITLFLVVTVYKDPSLIYDPRRLLPVPLHSQPPQATLVEPLRVQFSLLFNRITKWFRVGPELDIMEDMGCIIVEQRLSFPFYEPACGCCTSKLQEPSFRAL